MDASQLINPKKLKLLDLVNEEHKAYFKWFLALTEIPHGSNYCLELSKKIQEWIRHFGYEPETDQANNVVVRIPSNLPDTSSNTPIVALQAHIDMVLNGDIRCDQPVTVEITELDGVKVIRAPTSTLGADDGFGVAVMLEIVENSNIISHGPLELIFTTDEEIGIAGMVNLPPPPFLKFNYLINMDSLKGDKVYIGCAGGAFIEVKYNIPFESLQQNKDDFLFLRFNLKGLHGGHSGMNINLGYANSVKWTARILAFLKDSKVPFRFVKINAGSRTQNCIPTSFDNIIAVPKEMKDQALNLVHDIHTQIMFEYFRIECTDFFTEYVEIENPKAASVEQSARFTDLLLLIPNGVHRMSPQFPGAVQHSSNLSLFFADDGLIEFHIFPRSSSQSQADLFMTSFNSLLRIFGEKIETMTIENIPVWEPKMKSKLAKLVQEIYKEKTGENIELGLLPVSVEPSEFEKLGYTESEKVSICPSVPLAHTVGEWMGIDDSMKWRGIIHGTVEKLGKQ